MDKKPLPENSKITKQVKTMRINTETAKTVKTPNLFIVYQDQMSYTNSNKNKKSKVHQSGCVLLFLRLSEVSVCLKIKNQNTLQELFLRSR